VHTWLVLCTRCREFFLCLLPNLYKVVVIAAHDGLEG
jgi:hypothetical protein